MQCPPFTSFRPFVTWTDRGRRQTLRKRNRSTAAISLPFTHSALIKTINLFLYKCTSSKICIISLRIRLMDFYSGVRPLEAITNWAIKMSKIDQNEKKNQFAWWNNNKSGKPFSPLAMNTRENSTTKMESWNRRKQKRKQWLTTWRLWPINGDGVIRKWRQ